MKQDFWNIDELELEDTGRKLGDRKPSLEEVKGLPNPICKEFGHEIKTWEVRDIIFIPPDKFPPGRIIVRGGICKKCYYSFIETFCG